MSQPLTFVILGHEPDVASQIGQVIAKLPEARLLAVGSDLSGTHAEIVRLRPSAAIVAFGSQLDRELALIRQLSVECPETMIISAAADLSSETILGSLRAGAQEFLRLPIIISEFEAVLDRLREFASKHARTDERLGRVIAVFSNKGGCGTSFIASNLAAALNAPTLLLDLNLQGGDIGFFFGAEPKFSITDLVESRTRMDDELLAKFMIPHSVNLSILPAPADVDAAVDLSPDHVRETLSLLRAHHDYIVIDLAHTFDPITLAALDQADEILLVLALEVMTVRNALRTVSILDRLDYPRHKIHAVVNRWSRNDLDLGRRQIEQLLGSRAITLVPNDYRAAVNSINVGQPLVEGRPTSPIAVEIRRLAASLAGAVDPKVRARLGAEPRARASDEVVPPDPATEPGKEREKGVRDRLSPAARTWKRQIRSLFRPAKAT